MANQLKILPDKKVRLTPGKRARNFISQVSNNVAQKSNKVAQAKPERSKAQIGRGSRAKGAAGEREALGLLREWLAPVYVEMGCEPDAIKRNLDQALEGGCDLKGLPWLSIEIKRRETVSLGAWWTQTLEQTKPGEIPFLMWRVNRMPWRFRIRVPVIVGPYPTDLDVDMDEEAAHRWITLQLKMRLLAAARGKVDEWFPT